MKPLIRLCPHCGHDYDISRRLHADRVWCVRCGKWFSVVYRTDGEVYLAPCEAPAELQTTRRNTR